MPLEPYAVVCPLRRGVGARWTLHPFGGGLEAQNFE